MKSCSHFYAIVAAAILGQAAIQGSAAAQTTPSPTYGNPTTTVDVGKSRYEINISNGVLDLTKLSKLAVFPHSDTNASGMTATLSNVVEVLRQLHPDSTILVPPDLQGIKLNDLKLRGSDLESELAALSVVSGGKFQPALTARGTAPMFTLMPAPKQSEQVSVEVFNLGRYFQQLGLLALGESSEAAPQVERIGELILETLTSLSKAQGNAESVRRPDFRFHRGANLLIVTGTPQALEVARKIVSALEGTPGAGIAGAKNPVLISKERKALVAKLESMRLDQIVLDKLPLEEVVRLLATETRKQDPDKQGLNFLLDWTEPSPAPPGMPVDPVTGLPLPVERIDLTQVGIRISQPLRNIRLVDLLDAIVKTADQPIQYSITDYAVTFSLRPRHAPGSF